MDNEIVVLYTMEFYSATENIFMKNFCKKMDRTQKHNCKKKNPSLERQNYIQIESEALIVRYGSANVRTYK